MFAVYADFDPKIEHFLNAEVPLLRPRAHSNLRSGNHFANRNPQIPEIAITLIALQFAAFSLTAAYLAFSCAMLHHRNQISWEALVSRLHSAWLDAASPHGVPALASGRSASWSAWRDAGTLLQLANFADRHSFAIDPAILATLRADAAHLRFAALRSLIRPRGF